MYSNQLLMRAFAGFWLVAWLLSLFCGQAGDGKSRPCALCKGFAIQVRGVGRIIVVALRGMLGGGRVACFYVGQCQNPPGMRTVFF